jgi:DNA-binding transcriptional regulator of glucitol operon
MLNLPTTEERLGKSPQRLVRYFVLVMALVYLGLGVWLFWSAGEPASGGLLQLGTTGRRVLGGVFMLYGIMRFVRGYQTNFRKKTFSDNE